MLNKLIAAERRAAHKTFKEQAREAQLTYYEFFLKPAGYPLELDKFLVHQSNFNGKYEAYIGYEFEDQEKGAKIAAIMEKEWNIHPKVLHIMKSFIVQVDLTDLIGDLE